MRRAKACTLVIMWFDISFSHYVLLKMQYFLLKCLYTREYSYFTGKRSFGSQLELRLIILSFTKFKLIMKSGMSLLDYNLTNQQKLLID